jgi:hypothetical protein
MWQTSKSESEMRSADPDPTRRTAGQYARMTVRRLRMRTLVTLGVLAVATAMLGRLFGLHSWLFIVAELVLLSSMFCISRYVLPMLERRDRGASGEEHVGRLLDELAGPGWRVIHDATFGRGNIDHIVIGPPGVFTIETKSHPGPIRVSRIHGYTLEQARAQARVIEDVVGLKAEPVIVYSRAWVDRPTSRRKGVRVMPARMLVGQVKRRPTVLTREQVEHAHDRIAGALLEHHARERAIGERRYLVI